MNERSKNAVENYLKGYNCAQSVASAFAEEVSKKSGIAKETMLKATSSFGHGVGGQMLTCGCVSGMAVVAGLLYGYEHGKPEEKAAHNARIKNLTSGFKEKFGSVICAELLGKAPNEEVKKIGIAACPRKVQAAVEILEQYIADCQRK